MIRYLSNDVFHLYKGYEIKKVEKHYSCGDETFYVIVGEEGTNYDKLKDAKKEIDRRGNKA